MNVQTLSVKEAAEIFKVKPKTIRAWIAQGKLAANRIGRGYIIPAAEVQRAEPHNEETPPSTEMTEFTALLRSGGKVDKSSYIAQDSEDRRSDRKQSVLYPKRPDPERRARILAMKGTLIGTGLTLASIDDLRRAELAKSSGHVE